MADTLKYDPKHFYDENAFEIFDPIIDEVNDILEGKEVPSSCTITNNYLITWPPSTTGSTRPRSCHFRGRFLFIIFATVNHLNHESNL